MRQSETEAHGAHAAPHPRSGREIFLSGWFTEQFSAGKRPDYGYPKNHLPETVVDDVEMVTGFFAQHDRVK